MLLARRGAALALTASAASLSTARASMAPVVPLPTTAALAEAPLKPLLASSSEVTKGKELWRETPVVILAVRRPGCQLCRAEVSGLQAIKGQLDAAGVRLVAVLHEEREEQVAEFKADFWPGELFLDADKEVFKAVGGGQVRRGSLLAFMNPFSRIWTHVKESNRVVEKSNLVGDGLTFGGVLVVCRGGRVQYAFQEETFGDHAPPEDVLDAALKAAAAR